LCGTNRVDEIDLTGQIPEAQAGNDDLESNNGDGTGVHLLITQISKRGRYVL
jgi:hypothetical protein